MLIGLCGAKGSGKTTFANFLTKNSEKTFKIVSIDPKTYVLSELNLIDKEDEFINLMHKFVDCRWNWNWCRKYLPIYENRLNNWVELSFADSLKKVCSILFDYSYEILLGQENQKQREQRELIKTRYYNISGALTGRQVLEYFGTNIIRNNIDENLWVNLTKDKCLEMIILGKNIVISDVRFENERTMLSELKGKLVLIQRKNTSKSGNVQIVDLNYNPDQIYLSFKYDYIIQNDGNKNEFEYFINTKIKFN